MPIISKNGVDIEITEAELEQLYPRPVVVLPLSTRLEAILKDAGQVLAAEQNPRPELLALVDSIMTIDTKLSNLSNRFGGDSALYKAAAIAYLNGLGVLPDNLEPARQAMLAECEV